MRAGRLARRLHRRGGRRSGEPELAAKVDHGSDPRCEAIFPLHFPSIVTVVTTDGRTLVEEVLANRGTAERPLTEDDVRVKYDLNARPLGSEAAVVAERILSVAASDDVRGLLAL